jgi:hypothetical protein
MAVEDFTKRPHKLKRGGYRPGAGRKRKTVLRTQFLSARTTNEVKQGIEQVCVEEQITESDYLHRVILKDLLKRGVLVPKK